MKQDTAKEKESQVQLFELFSVEELESRLEFKRKRRNPRGVSGVNSFKFLTNAGLLPRSCEG